MSLPSIGTAAESAQSPLPMALEGQLRWVKRPLSSLSTLSSSQTPYLWWPSLLFNDYEDFQDFFPVEFDTTNNDATETNRLILARMFKNMRLQRRIIVARLLGRSIKEYVEIVEEPVQDYDGKSDECEAHEATEFIHYAQMPREVHLPQMDPATWVVELSDESAGNTHTLNIDDDLYTSYMLALDLAETKRFGGPTASRDTLGSHFRDIGREKLVKIPAKVKRLSETSSAALPDIELNDQEPVTYPDPDVTYHQSPSLGCIEDATYRETKIPPVYTDGDKPQPIDGGVINADQSLYNKRLAMRDMAPSKKASDVTNESLHKDGDLGILRLDRTLDHLPIQPRGRKKRCGLHRWQDESKEGQLMYCRSCNVNLCAHCYDLFHTVEDVGDLSNELRSRIEAIGNPKEKRNTFRCTPCTDTELQHGRLSSLQRLNKTIDHIPVWAGKKKDVPCIDGLVPKSRDKTYCTVGVVMSPCA